MTAATMTKTKTATTTTTTTTTIASLPPVVPVLPEGVDEEQFPAAVRVAALPVGAVRPPSVRVALADGPLPLPVFSGPPEELRAWRHACRAAFASDTDADVVRAKSAARPAWSSPYGPDLDDGRALRLVELRDRGYDPVCSSCALNAPNAGRWFFGWELPPAPAPAPDGRSARPRRRAVLCRRCFPRYAKSQYCPHCFYIYHNREDMGSEEAASRWIGCDLCDRWVHRHCEEAVLGLALGAWLGDSVYLCPVCRAAHATDRLDALCAQLEEGGGKAKD